MEIMLLSCNNTDTVLENVKHKEVALENREVKALECEKEPRHHSVRLLHESLQSVSLHRLKRGKSRALF